ncbi:MAG: mobile mystery protein B [Fluviibacter phosphoraccumulans]
MNVRMQFHYAPGATPLDPDEAAGLVPTHITTQNDLNAWEQANILQGDRWANRQKKHSLLDEGFTRTLHKKMFDQTWQWAGTFRKTNKNIGVDWPQISVKLKNLLDNTRYQIENQVFDPDEIVVRFHHQLVWIHAFPNGNGRHARLMADLLAMRLGQPRMSWGGSALVLTSVGTVRDQYLLALRAADQGQFEALIRFARS